MYTVNKAFSLIHIVPDQVLAWVGGHFKGFGGDEGQESHRNIAAIGQFSRQGAGALGKDMIGKTKEKREKAKNGGGSEEVGEGPKVK